VHRPALAKCVGQLKTGSGAPLGEGGRDFTRMITPRTLDRKIVLWLFQNLTEVPTDQVRATCTPRLPMSF
jgi:hypothetical protein